MPDKVIVYKDRFNVLPVSLGYDVSSDTLTSEIRTESGVLICTWTVTVDGDGTAGDLTLTLEVTDVDDIQYVSGLMDIKRVHGGKPYAVFDHPLEVEFRETVTQ